MDQTAYAAFKYSLYIAAVGVLSGHSGPTVRADVSAKIVPTLQTGWRFWPMAHLITYTLVPPRHRMLWVNCVDLVWVTLLATVVSEPPTPSEDAEGAATVLVPVDDQEAGVEADRRQHRR
mmetsp:Transcript_9859/g.29332  ORF Transcript_9859/g.29332 Transcript_9859/m.29332 type:complete len:120 (+) Transcript_9859:788-1147(+)